MIVRSMSVLCWVVSLMVLGACAKDSEASGITNNAGGIAAAGFAGNASSQEQVICGSSKCKAPVGFTGQLCCYDAFGSACGQQTSPTQCSVFPPQESPNCPDGTIVQASSAMLVRGCCLTDGSRQCGIDVTGFAMVCSSLSDFDIFPGSSAPAPTNCDGTPSM